MECPACKKAMESRLGEIDSVPVIISICLACKTSTCAMLGDASPIFEKVFREMTAENELKEKTTEPEVLK